MIRSTIKTTKSTHAGLSRQNYLYNNQSMLCVVTLCPTIILSGERTEMCNVLVANTIHTIPTVLQRFSSLETIVFLANYHILNFYYSRENTKLQCTEC